MTQGKTFIFFGIQGSGKGTQIKLLKNVIKEKDGAESLHMSPGVGYRAMVSSDSYISSLVKDSINRGELQPNFLTTTLATNILIDSLSLDKNLFFDGYPRNHSQAVSTEEMMKFFGRQDVKIVNIKISKEEAIRRNMLRGRDDDTEDGLARRFAWYFEEVVPLLEYFESKEGYEILNINGEQSIEEVHKDIIKALNI